MLDISIVKTITITYDHRLERIGHPVRSAIHKLQIGRLVVGWVTTSEYLLLYVFVLFIFFSLLLFLLVYDERRGWIGGVCIETLLHYWIIRTESGG